MNRVMLAIFGVVLAVALIVVIARESSNARSGGSGSELPDVAASAKPVAPEAGVGEPDVLDPEETEIEVKELSFGDGSANQRSIRIVHPSAELTTRLRDWLEPRESAAVASRSAIDCHAQVARTSLVSVVCVTMPAGESDAATAARYESLTLRVLDAQVKELTLADVLANDGGQAEVVAACKKVTTPSWQGSPCDWPPTAFAVGNDGALFLCHDSHCVNIEGDPTLVKPELR